MKIIYDNIIYSKLSQGGISNYWFELSKFLLKKKENIYFYENKETNTNFHRNLLEIPENKIIHNTNPSKSSILNRMSSVKINESDKFLYHSSYYRPLTGSNNYSEVTTVHDFTHNFYAPIHKKMVHNLIKYESIKRAKGIICVSNNTYKDLLKFCPPKKNQKVEIINNGVSDDFLVIEPSKIESKFSFSIEKNTYILYVGSRENYKNFNFVIELLKSNRDLKLIVVGKAFTRKEMQIIGETKTRINIASNVSNQDLNIFYNNALAFIYPSSYEGFGIPIIESMKAGCPVIALNASSIPEVAGNAGVLIDKLDPVLTNKIIKNLSQNDFRNEVIEKGIIHSKKFSWDKCCNETLDFYNEVF
jgi:mannosyltransferase